MCSADYQVTGITLGRHPLSFIRKTVQKYGCKTHQELQQLHHKVFVQIVGDIVDASDVLTHIPSNMSQDFH